MALSFKNFKFKKILANSLVLSALVSLGLVSNVKASEITNEKQQIIELKVGDSIPLFKLYNQKGELFDITSVLGKKNLVIYFYPKDDTPGCTKEACSFRDNYKEFEDNGAFIIGISSQSVESHKKFAKKYLLNFNILADIDSKVVKLFGAKGDLLGLIPARITYVVNKEGKIVYIYDSQINAEKHVDESLAKIKELNKL